jgi:hypothetical protein
VAEAENAVLDGRDEQQAAFKGQTQAVLLYFSDKAGVDVYEFPWWAAKFRGALTPILEAVGAPEIFPRSTLCIQTNRG